MSSAFGCNQKNSLLGSKLSKSNQVNPPEPVLLVANKNQVITAVIPFNTKRAAEIRQHMHATIVKDGQRIFIYRSVNGWTNIALDSTDANPKLTCDPITTLITAWREFNNCTAVSTVSIKWDGSDTVLGYDDIRGMEATFEALPDATNEDNAGSSKTDAEILYDMVESGNNKLEALTTKIEYIIDKVDKLAEIAGRDTSDSPSTPMTAANASRKRKAK